MSKSKLRPGKVQRRARKSTPTDRQVDKFRDWPDMSFVGTEYHVMLFREFARKFIIVLDVSVSELFHMHVFQYFIL